ncbi:unnamed protein product [Amaranthus hypochondriacus]
MSTSLELTTSGIDYQNNIVRSEDEFVNGTRTSDPRIRTAAGLPTFPQFIIPREENLDLNGQYLQRWNKIFLVLCLLALNCDPFFFYIQVINAEKQCITFDDTSRVIAICLRSSTDLFYLLHIFLKLYIRLGLSSSRLSLTDHPTLIANTYLPFYFIVDLLAVLPLPQMVVTVPIHNLSRVSLLSPKRLLHLVIFLQWIPRLMRIYPLHKEVKKTSGLITDSIWGGALFNLFLYMSASHVVGALWYFFTIDQMVRCWHKSCTQGCHDEPSLYCHEYDKQHVVNYNFNSTYCNFLDSDHAAFNFGLFIDALKSKVVQSNHLLRKLPYCFWWGLRNLSSCGQNLQTSTFFWEIAFATGICVVGLILFALLFGNIQKYLQMLLSTAHRENDMRERRQDIEQWMSREKLPNVIRGDIRRLEEFKWQKTRGFDEQSFFTTLPRELRFVIKQHQCSEFVKKVPMFTVLNNTLFKEIVRDRLKPLFYTEDSFIIQEGESVNKMIFIKSGRICITNKNNERNGFSNSVILEAGDFCGEESIMWALDHYQRRPSNLPISTRTVQTQTQVETLELFQNLPSVSPNNNLIIL